MGRGALYVRSAQRHHLVYLSTSSCRADYMDDEYIQELLVWEDPELVGDSECVFTESENAKMLNLPRKECKRCPRL